MSFTQQHFRSRCSISLRIAKVRASGSTCEFELIKVEDGTPLSLADICRLPLFRPQSLFGQQVASFAVQDAISSMALLSQGDHPTLGSPCWYVHPCNTSAIVGELMAEVEDKTWTDEVRCLRWIEAWFMVLGNVLCIDF